MEHIGTIETAGMRAKKSGEGQSFHVQVVKPKWGYYLFKPEHIKVAESNVGKRVRIVYTEGEGGFRNVDSIEALADAAKSETKGAPNGASRDDIIVRQVVFKAVYDIHADSGELAEIEFDWWVAKILGLPLPQKRTDREPMEAHGRILDSTSKAVPTKESTSSENPRTPVDSLNDGQLMQAIQAYWLKLGIAKSFAQIKDWAKKAEVDWVSFKGATREDLEKLYAETIKEGK